MQAVVNEDVNFRVPSYVGNYRLADNRLASQEGLCTME